MARKSAPDEQGYKVKERGVQFNVPKDHEGRGGNDYLYRMCCISVGNSPSYTAATLFDTGTHASFVNREVASGIEEHGGTNRQVPEQKRGWQKASSTMVSLAGTSMSSPILGSFVFDLTFLNEVSRRHETIKDIHAQVIDSCIAVIVSRPLIRANHLVQKNPLHFDDTSRSKPDLSQPVVPVTGAAARRPVAHAPHLWHRATVTPYARCQC